MADMRKGYIKLWRGIWENAIFASDERFDTRSAWIWLITHANHKRKEISIRGSVLKIERGQLFTSTRNLAQVFHWDVHTVMRFLRNTQKLDMTTSCATQNGTLITILNFNKYNVSGNSDVEESYTEAHTDAHTDAHNKSHTDAQQLIMIKNDTENEERMKKEPRAREEPIPGFGRRRREEILE